MAISRLAAVTIFTLAAAMGTMGTAMAYLPCCNLASLTEGQIDFIGARQPLHK